MAVLFEKQLKEKEILSKSPMVGADCPERINIQCIYARISVSLERFLCRSICRPFPLVFT